MPPNYRAASRFRCRRREWNMRPRRPPLTILGALRTVFRVRVYSKNPPRRRRPLILYDPTRTLHGGGGRLGLHPLLLFDMYGNVWEWTTSPAGVSRRARCEIGKTRVTSTTTRRSAAGISFSTCRPMGPAHAATSPFPQQRRDTSASGWRDGKVAPRLPEGHNRSSFGFALPPSRSRRCRQTRAL